MSYLPNSTSPPPLQHPVPTHPAYIPEPPSTPVSPQGYQRYTSSPPVQQPFAQPIPPQQAVRMHSDYASSHGQYQPMGPTPRQIPVHHGQPPNLPADLAAWGFDNPTAQFGMQLGQNAVAAGQEYVQRNLGGLIPISVLRHHFNVSNSYVMNKLRILLFPWRHKWPRRVRRSENGQSEWQPPREDVNAPDLYIPLMAIVTYILLAALHSGLSSRFHPEILGITASKALAVVLLDFVFVKLGCYFLNIPGSINQVLDLMAYDGYKFVGVIVTLVAGLLNVGRTLYFVTFCYSFLSTAFFLLRSLRYLILPDASATAAPVNSPAQRSRRIIFLFIVAMSQVLYMGILVRM
ncbi:YIF1-domain-containing protein [Laetiporus sulphureus 93-53]|uniref:Protein YIF1 n=1 Tax=Laetiporus sulphureus 93-53 TaxID=1314785 RepID=A0A165B657_9APHY|nr:YIF1-domain-containing protein [Laetiporus sulphureus 93-53]KZT00327.1 YIF1-domain-containing protein [Laetiporus sulphureus 93-53]